MWGVGSAGNLGYRNTLRQFLPRQVIGSLADVVVTKVCYPLASTIVFALNNYANLSCWLNAKHAAGSAMPCLN